MVAVIAATPLAIALTLPSTDTVATFGLLEDHNTVLSDAFSGETMGAITNSSPTFNVFSVGFTATLVTATFRFGSLQDKNPILTTDNSPK